VAGRREALGLQAARVSAAQRRAVVCRLAESGVGRAELAPGLPKEICFEVPEDAAVYRRPLQRRAVVCRPAESGVGRAEYSSEAPEEICFEVPKMEF